MGFAWGVAWGCNGVLNKVCPSMGLPVDRVPVGGLGAGRRSSSPPSAALVVEAARPPAMQSPPGDGEKVRL